MFTHKETKILAFAPEKLFALVSDVARYPDFLPWVAHARVYNVEESSFLADLTMGHHWFSDTYTSHVTFKAYKWVHAQHVKGPFKHLTTDWIFKEALGGGTCVDFSITFELQSLVFQTLLESFFAHACQEILTAFEERARVLS